MHQSKIIFQWNDSLTIDKVYKWTKYENKTKKEFVILYKYNVGYMVQAYRKGNNENKKQSIVKTRDPESNASPL